MKKTFLHLLLLMGCACCFPSCVEDKAEDAAARLTVSKVSVEVIRTGTLSTGSKATLDVLANRGYAITSDADWLSVDKPTGKGRVSVVLDVKPNETEAIRVGHLAVVSGGLSETVTVTRRLPPIPTTGWKSTMFISTTTFRGASSSAARIRCSSRPGLHAGRAQPCCGQAQIYADGYSEYNYGGNAFYMAKHYFKMGKNNQQNGLAIDMGKYIEKGKSSTITLTFDAAPVVSIDGTGSGMTLRGIDDTAVTVEVYEGPGTVDSPSLKQSASLSMSSVTSWNQWVSMKVTLYGVTDRSQIVIRSTQFGVSGYHRWYLDNIKMVKAPRD